MQHVFFFQLAMMLAPSILCPQNQVSSDLQHLSRLLSLVLSHLCLKISWSSVPQDSQFIFRFTSVCALWSIQVTLIQHLLSCGFGLCPSWVASPRRGHLALQVASIMLKFSISISPFSTVKARLMDSHGLSPSPSFERSLPAVSCPSSFNLVAPEFLIITETLSCQSV